MIFLKDRKQRVVFNDHHSSWIDVEAGDPQGSILRPLLFLIHIIKIYDILASNLADYTSLFYIVKTWIIQELTWIATWE